MICKGKCRNGQQIPAIPAGTVMDCTKLRIGAMNRLPRGVDSSVMNGRMKALFALRGAPFIVGVEIRRSMATQMPLLCHA